MAIFVWVWSNGLLAPFRPTYRPPSRPRSPLKNPLRLENGPWLMDARIEPSVVSLGLRRPRTMVRGAVCAAYGLMMMALGAWVNDWRYQPRLMLRAARIVGRGLRPKPLTSSSNARGPRPGARCACRKLLGPWTSELVASSACVAFRSGYLAAQSERSSSYTRAPE